MQYTFKLYKGNTITRNIISKSLDLIQKLPWVKNPLLVVKKITSYCLVYHKKNYNKAVWFACIKNSSERYRNILCRKTHIQHIPKKEIGYMYISIHHRRKHLWEKICKILSKKNSFATTAESNIAMQKSLIRNNFKQIWKPYKSNIWAYTLLLFVNLTKNKKTI